jgi:hypothetical protein
LLKPHGCPTAIRAAHLPGGVFPFATYLQYAPSPQRAAGAVQSPPMATRAATVGLQMPAQHMVPPQAPRSQLADTHSSGAKQGDPSAIVPVKICSHAGSLGWLPWRVKLQVALAVERAAFRQVAAATPSYFVLPEPTTASSCTNSVGLSDMHVALSGYCPQLTSRVHSMSTTWGPKSESSIFASSPQAKDANDRSRTASSGRQRGI